jgi:hypothetical protein
MELDMWDVLAIQEAVLVYNGFTPRSMALARLNNTQKAVYEEFYGMLYAAEACLDGQTDQEDAQRRALDRSTV